MYSQDCTFLLKYGVISNCTLQSGFTFNVQLGLGVRIQPVKPVSCLCILIYFTVPILFVCAKLCETYYKENVLTNYIFNRKVKKKHKENCNVDSAQPSWRHTSQ